MRERERVREREGERERERDHALGPYVHIRTLDWTRSDKNILPGIPHLPGEP